MANFNSNNGKIGEALRKRLSQPDPYRRRNPNVLGGEALRKELPQSQISVDQELFRDFSHLLDKTVYDREIECTNTRYDGNLKAMLDDYNKSPTNFSSDSAEDFMKLALYNYDLMWYGVVQCMLTRFRDIERKLDEIQDRLDDLE